MARASYKFNEEALYKGHAEQLLTDKKVINNFNSQIIPLIFKSPEVMEKGASLKEINISPNGRVMIAKGKDAYHLWDMITGTPLTPIIINDGKNSQYSFDNEGNYLAIYSKNG